jgi:alpha-tubulin suppressor-like RCC1 family protein
MKDITSYMLIALAMLAFLSPACVQGHTTLTIGQHHSMQIDKDQTLWGWGYNNAGQLGKGDTSNAPTPQPVPLTPALSGDPVSVCAGPYFTCVLDSNKDVACTGSDLYGQMGEGGSQADKNVLEVPTGVALVDHLGCGSYSVLATTSTGNLLVWGKDSEGQLGRGSTSSQVWVAEVSFVLILAFLNVVDVAGFIMESEALFQRPIYSLLEVGIG